MRNLEQYPITEDEIVQCLKELMDGLSYEKTGLVGDMRPVLLANAIRIILTSVPAQGAPTITDEMVNAAAREMWNDRDARHGGGWDTRDPREVCVIQTKATARAALTAALTSTKR